MQNKSLLVLASVFVTIGVLMTLENFSVISGVSRLWPTLSLFVGIGFITLFYNRGKSDSALIWLGTFLAGISLLFYYFNFTTWIHIADLWPFFLCIAGISFLSIRLFNPEKQRLFLYLALAFLALGLIFYLVFGVSLHLWPVSLVIFGLSLLLINSYYRNKG